MTKRFLVCGVVALLGATPAFAQNFTAENGVDVVQTGNGFAVTGDAGIGARGMWCAAADYARSVKGARSAQRLFIQEGRKTGRSPVIFALTSPDAPAKSVTILGLSLRSEGANLSVGHAYSFCADHKLRQAGGRP